MSFRSYLKTQYNYSQTTLIEKEKQLQNWKLKTGNHQDFDLLNSEEILKIIKIQKHYYQTESLNNQLKTLEDYFYYLIEIGKRKDHPIKGFRIKTQAKPLLKGILTKEELQEIYENYSTKGHFGGCFNLYAQRNKTILGLIIYQALNTKGIAGINLQDINLERGLIHIKAGSKLKARSLKLESQQILEIHQYIHQTRAELLDKMDLKESQKLYVLGKKTNFSSITQAIKKKIQTQEISTLYQLRASRISLWLKQYNLREVQYRAGYKSLLSLEKYKTDQLESLQQAVEKYHVF